MKVAIALTVVLAAELFIPSSIGATISGSFHFGANGGPVFSHVAGNLVMVAVPVGEIEGSADEQAVDIDGDTFKVDWTGPGEPIIMWSNAQKAFSNTFVVWPDRRDARQASRKGFKFASVSEVRKEASEEIQRLIKANVEESWKQADQILDSFGRAMDRLDGPLNGRPAHVLRHALVRQVSDDASKLFIPRSRQRQPIATSTAIQRKWLYQRIADIEKYEEGHQRSYLYFITFAAFRDFATYGYFSVDNFAMYRLAKKLSDFDQEKQPTSPQDKPAASIFAAYEFPSHNGPGNINPRKAFAEDIGEILRQLCAHPELAETISKLLNDPKVHSKWRVGKEPEKEFGSRKKALTNVYDLIKGRLGADGPPSNEEVTEWGRALQIDDFYYFCNVLYEYAAERIVSERDTH